MSNWLLKPSAEVGRNRSECPLPLCLYQKRAWRQDRTSLYRNMAGIDRRGPWRSFEAVVYATLEWVDRFYNRRLLEPISIVPAHPDRLPAIGAGMLGLAKLAYEIWT